MYKAIFPKFGKRYLHTKGKWAVVRTKHKKDSLGSEKDVAKNLLVRGTNLGVCRQIGVYKLMQ